MNNNHQSLTVALSAFQASLEKMNVSLADSFKPSILGAQSAFQPALLDFQRSIAETMAISPQINLAAQMQAQRDALIAPIRQLQETWNIPTLAHDSFQQQIHIMQNSLSSFSTALQGIMIYKDYVSVPETLIPDDFQCKEVSDVSSLVLKQNSTQTERTKNLSLPDTLALLNLLAVILVFLLAPFYNHAIEDFLDAKENAKPNTPISEEQAQQVLKYLSEIADYKQAISTALETSPESSQESVSSPPNSGSIPSYIGSTPSNALYNPQCDSSQSGPAGESHPTEVDDSDNFESHQ